MKFNQIILSILILAITSCTNLSKNMVTDGDFTIRSGRVGNYKWDDRLVFHRASWYHELTLLFDFMYVKIEEKSPFYNWFSLEEKKRISECQEKILVLSYAMDSERISQVQFKNILRNYGLEDYSVPNFQKALKTHPDFEKLSLSLYKVDLFCSKQKLSSDIFITFPNFSEYKLNF